MKILCIFLAFVLGAFSIQTRPGVRPDETDFDQRTEANYYQSCITQTSWTPITYRERGTSCVVYNPNENTVHFTVLHSETPWDVISLAITGSSGFQSVTYLSDQWMPEVHFRPGTRHRPATPPHLPAVVYTDLFHMPITGKNQGLENTNIVITDLSHSLTITLTLRRGRTITWEFTRWDFIDTFWGFESRKKVESNQNGQNYKFPTSYVETFAPRANRVLLLRNNFKGAFNDYSENQATVVAVGPLVTDVKEGQTVLFNKTMCFTQLIQFNQGLMTPVDNVLAQSPYCWVEKPDIHGIISEEASGANRAKIGTRHIKKPVGTSYIWDRYASFNGFY